MNPPTSKLKDKALKILLWVNEEVIEKWEISKATMFQHQDTCNQGFHKLDQTKRLIWSNNIWVVNATVHLYYANQKLLLSLRFLRISYSHALLILAKSWNPKSHKYSDKIASKILLVYIFCGNYWMVHDTFQYFKGYILSFYVILCFAFSPEATSVESCSHVTYYAVSLNHVFQTFSAFCQSLWLVWHFKS